MAKKFEIINNYLVVTDTVTDNVELEFPNAETYFRDNNGTIRFYNSHTGVQVGYKREGIPFGATSASGTVTIDTTSATQATGTVTCATVLENTFATGTVTCASVLAADTVTVNGLVYTAVAGAKSDNTEFSIDTGDTECATDLADSITNDTRSGTTGDQTATNSLGVVTITTDVLGTGGNAITLVSSNGTRLAVSGATLSGGVDADTVTVNGLLYTAVAGVKADNTEFSTDTSDTATAADLADSITNDTREGTVNDVTATDSTGVVTITASVGGTIGNTVPLESSDGTTLAVSGATLTGGLDDAEVTGITVNAVQVMSGAETSIDDPATLASQVAANITAHNSTPNYNATANGAVVTITSAVFDTGANGYVVVSTPSNATTTDVNLAGGAADIVDSGDTIFATKAALLTFLRTNTGA